MKQPTNEILAAANALRGSLTTKQILDLGWNPDGTRTQATDENRLSYSQFWLYCARHDLLEKSPNLDFAGAVTPETVVERRNAGFSWGEIAVQANLPESRIRKIFEEATAVRTKGLRTGQGGRFLQDDEVFYQAEHRVTGTAIPVTKKIYEARDELHKEIEKARERRRAAEAKKAQAAAKRAAKKAEAQKPKAEVEA